MMRRTSTKDDRINVVGTKGCPLLANIDSICKTEAEGHGSSSSKSKNNPMHSMMAEARRLYDEGFAESHQSGSYELMHAVRKIERKGGFGLGGGADMVNRLQKVVDGADTLDLSNTPTVDELVQHLTTFFGSPSCRLLHIEYVLYFCKLIISHEL